MEYYEDPVRRSGGDGRSPSRDRSEDEHQHVRDAASPTFRKRSELQPIDVLLCDHHYFGGFAGCQALGPISRAAGWTLSQHSNNHAGVTMAAMIHLAASIPELTLASDTHYPWLVEGADIIEGPNLTIQGGRMPVPPGPDSASLSIATSWPAPMRPIRSAGCAAATTDR